MPDNRDWAKDVSYIGPKQADNADHALSTIVEIRWGLIGCKWRLPVRGFDSDDDPRRHVRALLCGRRTALRRIGVG